MTAEAKRWPELANIAALCTMGVGFADAWEMSPGMAERLLAVQNAMSIDPKQRDGGFVMGTASDLKALLT